MKVVWEVVLTSGASNYDFLTVACFTILLLSSYDPDLSRTSDSYSSSALMQDAPQFPSSPSPYFLSDLRVVTW
jgi:hypothetical protein